MNALVTIMLASILAVAGCSRIAVQSEHDEAFDFGTLTTYRWTEGGSRSLGQRTIDRDALDRQVREVADRVMTEKGYVRTASDDPDFLLSYHTLIETRRDESKTNEAHGYSSGWWGRSGDEGLRPADDGGGGGLEYQEGTLVIAVLEPGSRRQLWRGSARTEVLLSNSPDSRERRIRRVVEKILERFPPPR